MLLVEHLFEAFGRETERNGLLTAVQHLGAQQVAQRRRDTAHKRNPRRTQRVMPHVRLRALHKGNCARSVLRNNKKIDIEQLLEAIHGQVGMHTLP